MSALKEAALRAFYSALRVISPLPNRVPRSPSARMQQDKGFRFPSPASQPPPAVPTSPSLDPAQRLAKNAYYARASVPPTVQKLSREQLEAEKLDVKAMAPEDLLLDKPVKINKSEVMVLW